MHAVGGAFHPNATFDEAWWLLEHEIPAVASHAYDLVAARAAIGELDPRTRYSQRALNA